MARSQVRQSEALRKARERQRELDKEEDQRREASRVRVAQASASAIVALERRADAEQALETATAAVGDALRGLLAEDVDAERAAALLELDVAEVRRLTKATPVPSATPPARTAGQASRRRTGSAGDGSDSAAPAASVTALAERGEVEESATTTAEGTADAGRRAG